MKKKKLRIGDYVDYVPNGESSVSVDIISPGESMHVEDLDWVVFDIKDNGTVELISENSTTSKITIQYYYYLYNNGVYTLNDISNRLYKNSSVGASARSINIEDVTSKVKSGFNYLESVSGYKAYGTKNTYSGRIEYPGMLKYLSTATVDGVTGNGIYNDNSNQSLTK